MVSESLLVPEETSGIWRLEAKATWLPSDGEVPVSVPCVHLLWALHRLAHTVRPVEWTSHRLWDPHIQNCARTKWLSTHHFAFAGERLRVGRGPIRAASPWSRVDSHLTCILSHSSALQLHPLFFFSQRQKKYIALEVSLNFAICSRTEHKWWGGRNDEQVRKQ